MRICYLADAKSVHTLKWAGYFAGKGHEVHVITSWVGKGYPADVQLHLLPSLLPQSRRGSGYINTLPSLIKTRRLINVLKPDIVDAHYITVYGYLGALSGFRPLVLTAWGSDVLIVMKESLCLRMLGKYALKKASVITCNSEVVRRALLGFGAESDRIKIVRQGIDTQKFRPQSDRALKDRLGLPEGPVVISTRSFQPVYNLEMLIRAIPLVLQQFPGVTFVIAGAGEQGDYLKDLATTLGCAPNVRFVGWLAQDELPGYLASSDVYVSTSLSDSASLSLHEAMACELAPVVTDLPGNREWIADGENGFLIPVNDIQALADRIIQLLKNKELTGQFGRVGRRLIQERAEYEKEMARMEKLYEGLMVKR